MVLEEVTTSLSLNIVHPIFDKSLHKFYKDLENEKYLKFDNNRLFIITASLSQHLTASIVTHPDHALSSSRDSLPI